MALRRKIDMDGKTTKAGIRKKLRKAIRDGGSVFVYALDKKGNVWTVNVHKGWAIDVRPYKTKTDKVPSDRPFDERIFDTIIKPDEGLPINTAISISVNFIYDLLQGRRKGYSYYFRGK